MILTTLPFSTLDAPTAENLCSWIYRLNGRKQHTACLLVAAHDAHPELQLKLRISAEVAFAHVDLLVLPKHEGSKNNRVNHAIRHASHYIASNYRTPWLWLEPDCVPVKSDWLEQLEEAYGGQPKRYLAAHQDWGTPEKPRICIARQAVYPTGANRELDPMCNTNDLFERYGGLGLATKSTRTRLIQQVPEWTPQTVIREDAVIVHRDKSGDLIRKLRARMNEQVLA